MLVRILLTILLVLGSLTIAAERWYEIEVILFEQANDERLNAEKWQEQPPLADLSKLNDILAQSTYLQDINNLCYRGNYYQVKPLPDLVEEIVIETSDLTEDNLEIDTTDEQIIEDLVIEDPFQLLSEDEHELKDVYAQLRRRRGYRMLLHKAWRQPMQPRAEAIPMRFYAGQDFGNKYNYEGDLLNPPEADVEVESGELLDVFDESESSQSKLEYQSPLKRFQLFEPIPDLMNIDRYYRMTTQQRAREQLQRCDAMLSYINQQQEVNVWQIDGFIKFYAERFRHIETNLALRIPGTEEVSLEAEVIDAVASEFQSTEIETSDVEIADNVSPDSTPSENWVLDESLLTIEEEKLTELREILAHYTMQQRRRIIDEKIHYFDHPLIGLIIQMRAYDPEEAAQEDQQ